MQTGNRVYHQTERKRRKRLLRRANKTRISKKRQRSSRDQTRALRAKGLV